MVRKALGPGCNCKPYLARLNLHNQHASLLNISILLSAWQWIGNAKIAYLEKSSSLTVFRSAKRVLTPLSISSRSCGFSGQGYKDALKLKTKYYLLTTLKLRYKCIKLDTWNPMISNSALYIMGATYYFNMLYCN